MNVLYERYVAHWIRVNYPDAMVITQDRRKKLFGIYGLRPDIVVELGDETVILDTKWKCLNGVNEVSVEDAQQMHAYISSYDKCNEAYLLYPRISDIPDMTLPDNNTGEVLHLSFIDLFDVKTIVPIKVQP